ncbi:class I SAM-dependent methyltransferase [Kerstersia sp.]|uniref:class I SAM-dependent methyltransferase n=1 Tax=Kerstersia sp. TaxID=1930783 RepID=UPI003F8F656F
MSAHNNRYGRLAAQVYHLDKPIGHSFGDVAFYLERLQHCPGPILEPAAGNGRILIPLLQAGLDIHGFDASADMLALCRTECAQRGLPAPVTQQTFEAFQYDQPFAAIIIPAGSFQLITDHAAATDVLRRCHHALQTQGRLILDLDPAHAIHTGGHSVRAWQPSPAQQLTLTCDRLQTDHINQISVDLLRYEAWENGLLQSTELESFSLRWWGVQEMLAALRAAGFTGSITVSGSYAHGRWPTDADTIITFEAVKP